MYDITVELTFKAGHYLTFPDCGPEEPHKHNWKVRATVESLELDKSDLVMDFHLLQAFLKDAVSPLSLNEYVNEMAEFSNKSPSTESIVRFIYDHLVDELPDRVRLSEMTLWETADCWARYRP